MRIQRWAIGIGLSLTCLLGCMLMTAQSRSNPWLQWGHDADHSGSIQVAGQSPDRNLVDIEYDPLAAQEQSAAGGDLLVHYQVPLIDDDGSVYMEFKSGTFDPNTTAFSTLIWTEKKISLSRNRPEVVWSYQTDWIPPGSYRDFWEPVFHPVISGQWIYLPGRGGSVWKLNKDTGEVNGRLNPFGANVDPNIFIVSPLSAAADGSVYYNAVKLASAGMGFLDADPVDSWLVKIDGSGASRTASYSVLVPNAPATCLGTFTTAQLPWPPAPNAVPTSSACGIVRTAINSAPAIGADGTVYTTARAHRNGRYGWIIAANTDLTLKWASSLRDRLHDGCNAPDGMLPPNGAPGGCRAGATAGVDPATNRPGAGRISDSASSTVTIAPDGILYGAFNRYNYSQGHLMKFDFDGNFVGAFGFGWDTTAAIYTHGRSYSVILKNNHYNGLGPYCDDDGSGRYAEFCPADRNTTTPATPEQYFVTQLSADMKPEWNYQNTNTQSCSRDSAGGIRCTSDHPYGFEWCVNAPVVDMNGVVYANSEDGRLYAIEQGGGLRKSLFQQLSLGAAYTPMSIGPDGRLYSQNAGHLFVAGQDIPARRNAGGR